MKKSLFYSLLFLIIALGLTIRLKDYDSIPPFGNTYDEVMYPWGGITFLQTGVPSSWTLFPTTRNIQTIEIWNHKFNIATPWVEKPPLYPLITGVVSIMFGQKTFESIQLSTLRLIPIILSLLTIFFTGLFATSIFNKQIGLIAALIYASTPTIAITNRLSLTENLLTPISLIGLYLTVNNSSKFLHKLKPYFIGIISGLAILTRQLGIALPIAIVFFLMSKKKIKESTVVFTITLLIGAIYPLIGLYFGWNLFLSVLRDYRMVYAIGLPETIQNIFRFPMLMYQKEPFLDGSILAGYLLLFTGPFIWAKKKIELFSYPIIYLTILALTESGKDIFGWHLYPLFPFLSILLAKFLMDVWKNINFFNLSFIFLILGSSTYRFLIQLVPSVESFWQKGLVITIIMLFVTPLVKSQNYRKILLISYFLVFIIINIMMTIYFGRIFLFTAGKN